MRRRDRGKPASPPLRPDDFPIGLGSTAVLPWVGRSSRKSPAGPSLESSSLTTARLEDGHGAKCSRKNPGKSHLSELENSMPQLEPSSYEDIAERLLRGNGTTALTVTSRRLSGSYSPVCSTFILKSNLLFSFTSYSMPKLCQAYKDPETARCYWCSAQSESFDERRKHHQWEI